MKNKQAQKMGRVLKALKQLYPHATCALKYSNPFQLVVATILSAQCTDKRVNLVTPVLFKKFKNAEDFAWAELQEIEELIRTTGFFRNKAKNIVGCARMLKEKYRGKVPQTMDELIHLPGVGRKTANVILAHAFGKNEGVCVDTHVGRLSRRIGFTHHENPVKVEQDLMQLALTQQWTSVSDLLIAHGRAVCDARKPKCEACTIRKECAYYSRMRGVATLNQ
jgi:endonuclease-3